MSEQDARQLAADRSRLRRREVFVVYAPEDDTGAGAYFVASSFDLDTFYQGGPDPVACYINGRQEEGTR